MLVHSTSHPHAIYTVHVASNDPDEATHFTEAVSVSFLYLRVSPHHLQGTIHFPTRNLISYTYLSVKVLTSRQTPSIPPRRLHRHRFRSLHRYRCFSPSLLYRSISFLIENEKEKCCICSNSEC